MQLAKRRMGSDLSGTASLYRGAPVSSQPRRCNDVAGMPRHGKGAPIVVATTYEQTEILKDLLEDRPAAFLVLPAGPDDVSRLLSELEESVNRI